MPKYKEQIEVLKTKNLKLESELKSELAQNFQPIKKIKKYLSIYLYSLFGISTTGALVVLAAFFTPWLPSIATTLIAAFKVVVSTLALPLLIAVPIITMAVLLFPIAAFLWKKHQVNSELSNSFENLKKSLESLERGKTNAEEAEAECKLRQALFILNFLEAEKNPNYDNIDKLLAKYKISAEWIFVVDLMKNDRTIPDTQNALEEETNKHTNPDEVDFRASSRNNQVQGVNPFIFRSPLNFAEIQNITELLKSSESENADQLKDIKDIKESPANNLAPGSSFPFYSNPSQNANVPINVPTRKAGTAVSCNRSI